MAEPNSAVDKLWKTQRENLTDKYDAAGKPYIVSTKPLFSTMTLEGTVVVQTDADNNKYAFVVFEKQQLDFFSYGIGMQAQFGGYNRKATPSDTNLAKPKNTNGAANFVIEGLSLHCRGIRQQDSEETAGHFAPFPTTGNADVDAGIAGQRLMVDPASIFLVPQLYSPFNLENAALQGVLGELALDIAWDEERFERIGTGMYLPQGGAGSELRSNGVPQASNVASVPEGYLWAGTGKTDAELTVRAILNEPVIMPITLNDNPNNDAEVCVPSKVWLDLVVKLHGFEFKYPSGN